MKKNCAEPDVDDKKTPVKKTGKKGKPVSKAKPQWANIANRMLGGE